MIEASNEALAEGLKGRRGGEKGRREAQSFPPPMEFRCRGLSEKGFRE